MSVAPAASRPGPVLATQQTRIAVIGLAGVGKSTFARTVEDLVAERGLICARLKLAAPLYSLQQQVYEVAGSPIAPGMQDQVLMESLADALRRIDGTSIVNDFVRRLASVTADVVVNDDLRDPHVDAVRLREHGFRIVRVVAPEDARASRLASRGDLSRSDRSTREIDRITPDVVLENAGDLASYRAAVRELLGGWL